MRCPNCSFDNPTDMNFCGKCGTALALHCLQCGFNNAPDFAFCGKCGAALTGKTKVKRQKSKGKSSIANPQPPIPSLLHAFPSRRAHSRGASGAGSAR
ncbi:MAG: zinc ribbon domain-containing protein [Deltaproteobacteria bacterium]|nr:zinc ribbon domain-containing protein [Deltaproteobacteria bacterium]